MVKTPSSLETKSRCWTFFLNGIFLGCIFPKITKKIQLYKKKKVYPKISQIFCQKVKKIVGGKNFQSWILRVQFQHSLGLGFRNVQNMKVLI
jgi:hypothetical protein